jgi:hypothetical protein
MPVLLHFFMNYQLFVPSKCCMPHRLIAFFVVHTYTKGMYAYLANVYCPMVSDFLSR